MVYLNASKSLRKQNDIVFNILFIVYKMFQGIVNIITQLITF